MQLDKAAKLEVVEEKLIQLIGGWSDDIVRLVCELVATPSETPPGDERKVARVLLDTLDRLELRGAIVASELPERPNVLYRLKGTDQGKTLLAE